MDIKTQSNEDWVLREEWIFFYLLLSHINPLVSQTTIRVGCQENWSISYGHNKPLVFVSSLCFNILFETE